MIKFQIRKKERRIAERRTLSVTNYKIINKERRIAPRRSVLDRRVISIQAIRQHNQ